MNPDPTSVPLPAPAAKRRRFRLWLLRAGMLLALLLILAGAAVQLVLSTSWPRERLIADLQEQLGLRLSATSLETDWLGHSTLRNVTVSQPLSGEPILDVPVVQLVHRTLFSILLGRHVRVSEAALVRPTLTVRRDSLGQWNVQEAVSAIIRAQRAVAPDMPAAIPRMPRVEVYNGTVHVIDRDGRTASLAPLRFTGKPDGPLVWAVSASIGPYLRTEGRLAPAQSWAQDFTFAAEDLAGVLRPWAAWFPSQSRIAGRWHGQYADGQVSGRMELADSHIGPWRLAGAADVSGAAGALVVSPRPLRVEAGRAGPIVASAGVLKLSASRLDTTGLVLSAMGGAVKLDGSYDWLAAAGAIDAAWDQLAFPGGIRHTGSLHATVTMPWPSSQEIRAALATQGSSPYGDWSGELSVHGQGRSWDELDWNVAARKLQLHSGDLAVDLAGLAAEVQTTRQHLRLSHLHLGEGGRAAGSGAVAFATGRWWLWLDLHGLQLPHMVHPVAISLNAWGDRQQAGLSRLEYRAGPLHASAWGRYDRLQPQPLDAEIYVWQVPFALDPSPHAILARPAITRGWLHARAHAAGSLFPADVGLAGRLDGHDVYVGHRFLGDVSLQVRGHVDDQLAALDSTELRLMGGRWAFHARYAWPDDLATLGVDVADLSLRQACEFLGAPALLDGSARISILASLPDLDPQRLTVTGNWAVRDLGIGIFAAQSAAGHLSIRGDALALEGVHLEHHGGRADALLGWDLRDRSRLSVQVVGRDWPLRPPGTSLAMKLTADADLHMDLRDKTAKGPLSLSVQASLGDADLGSLRAIASLDGRRARISSLTADVFGGRVEGHGLAVLDDWPASNGAISWQGLDSADLSRVWPAAAGFHGILSGSLDVAPNDDRHATEPMLAVLRVTPQDGGYRGFPIGPLAATLAASRERIVLSQGSVSAGGGELAIWGRLSHHGDDWFALLQANLDRVDLAAVIRLFSSTDSIRQGRVSGQITAFGPPRRPREVSADAQLRLADSDLITVDIFAAIQQALNPGVPPATNGTGGAALHLENGALSVVSLYYRAGGMFVRLTSVISDIFAGGRSPVAGYAIAASVRPNAPLPGVGQVTDILRALGGVVTTFRISGTVASHRVQGAGLEGVDQDLRRMLAGDVEAATVGTAGR